MTDGQSRIPRAVGRLVDDLQTALADRLVSVVLYGSAARGDDRSETSDLNLLLVVSDLDAGTLQAMATPIGRWVRSGQPLPRFFSPALIRDSADVFPIEILDLREHGIVVHGRAPFAEIEIDREHLRLQCERELREKMMRLREGYIETNARPKRLASLMRESYSTFVALFRGCLRLVDRETPLHDGDVVRRFCEMTGVDPSPLEGVARLREGDGGDDPGALFLRYYETLGEAVRGIDRLSPRDDGRRSVDPDS